MREIPFQFRSACPDAIGENPNLSEREKHEFIDARTVGSIKKVQNAKRN